MKYTIILLLVIQISAFSHPGIGIVEDLQGNIYYTDLTHVWKIGTDGKKAIAVRNVHTHELFMDERGNLFGEHLWYEEGKSNLWNHFVWKLGSDGKYEKLIPDTPGFLENYSFVRDHFGRMYWADRTTECQKVMRRNSDNTTSKLGDQCFHNIRFMKSTSEGDVYVMDFQDLKKIDRNGRVKIVGSRIADKSWTNSTVENQNAVMGVWDDKLGNIYTAILSSGMVKRFSRTGQEEMVFKTTAPWMPSGGLVDSKGNLWILECSPDNSVRVERVNNDKSRMVY